MLLPSRRRRRSSCVEELSREELSLANMAALLFLQGAWNCGCLTEIEVVCHRAMSDILSSQATMGLLAIVAMLIVPQCVPLPRSRTRSFILHSVCLGT